MAPVGVEAVVRTASSRRPGRLGGERPGDLGPAQRLGVGGDTSSRSRISTSAGSERPFSSVRSSLACRGRCGGGGRSWAWGRSRWAGGGSAACPQRPMRLPVRSDRARAPGQSEAAVVGQEDVAACLKGCGDMDRIGHQEPQSRPLPRRSNEDCAAHRNDGQVLGRPQEVVVGKQHPAGSPGTALPASRQGELARDRDEAALLKRREKLREEVSFGLIPLERVDEDIGIDVDFFGREESLAFPFFTQLADERVSPSGSCRYLCGPDHVHQAAPWWCGQVVLCLLHFLLEDARYVLPLRLRQFL